MILSTKARYGVRAMHYLAQHYDENIPLSINNISTDLELSEQYLEQLFSKLKKASLVNSIRGKNGGYVLTSNPKELSIGQIIRALEGELAPSQCSHDPTCCDNVGSCKANRLWISIYHEINEIVDSYFLSDMLE